MNYEEFIQKTRTSMEQIVGEEYIVSLHKVMKNNDIELDAIVIKSRDNNISPTIYLMPYYEEYMSGRDFGEIVSEIYQMYEKHKNTIEFDTDMFKSFDNIKKRIAYKLINSEENQRLLKDVPHVDFLNLSLVFYCLLDSDYFGSATALIHNVHLDMWKINEETLFEVAQKNTPILLPHCINNMRDVVKELLVTDIQNTLYENDYRYDESCSIPSAERVAENLMNGLEIGNNGVDMYVLTNVHKMNGAVCILYENVLRDFSEEQGTDLFILPSSIHEVIIVPDNGELSGSDLRTMVRDVNRKELEPGDVLSDEVYKYMRETDSIELVDIEKNPIKKCI